MTALIRRCFLVAIVAALSACASVDFDAPKSVTYVLTDTDDTFLGKQLAGVAAQHPGESGFYLLPDGIDALAARLLLAARAERTLDAQLTPTPQHVSGEPGFTRHRCEIQQEQDRDERQRPAHPLPEQVITTVITLMGAVGQEYMSWGNSLVPTQTSLK